MNRTFSILAAMVISTIATAQVSSPKMKVEFVTPKIVRVQWSADGVLSGNNTGVCIYEKQQVKSGEIMVKTEDGCISFIDRKTGKPLLKDIAREAEPVVQERIVYDDATARMEETANGKVTVKDIVRRDTIGLSTRYISHFSCPDTKALYGLGAHMEDYMNLVGKTMWLTQHNLKVTVPFLISHAPTPRLCMDSVPTGRII